MTGTRRRALVLRIVPPLVCVAGVAWVASTLDRREILALARRSDPWLLALSFAPLVLRFWIWGAKFAWMIRPEAPLGVREATRDVAAGAFLNLVTPTAKLAGGVLRAARLRRRWGWRRSESYGWILADQLTNVLGNLALFGVLALAAAGTLGGSGLAGPLAAAGAFALATTIATLALRRHAWNALRRPALRRRLLRFAPARDQDARADPDDPSWLERWLGPALGRRDGAAAGARDIGMAAAAWALLCAANALALAALGVRAPFLQVSAMLVLATFAGTFSGLGGIGVTEAVLIALYTRIGVDTGTAAAGALLHRAGYYLVILGWGGFAFLRGSRGRGSRPPTLSDGRSDRCLPRGPRTG